MIEQGSDDQAPSGVSTNSTNNSQIYTTASQYAGSELADATSTNTHGKPTIYAQLVSFGGTVLNPGECQTQTLTVNGTQGTSVVDVTPVVNPGDGFFWRGVPSGANTVAVSVCSGGVTAAPAVTNYNIRVTR
jgi:hypothetical protein